MTATTAATPLSDQQDVPSESERRIRAWGLIERRAVWRLTLRGRLSVLILGLAALATCFLRLYPFLAVNQPVVSTCLVIEGWIPETALQNCLEEFRAERYSRMVTVGGPCQGIANLEP